VIRQENIILSQKFYLLFNPLPPNLQVVMMMPDDFECETAKPYGRFKSRSDIFHGFLLLQAN